MVLVTLCVSCFVGKCYRERGSVCECIYDCGFDEEMLRAGLYGRGVDVVLIIGRNV